jgi:hypothetical protein
MESAGISLWVSDGVSCVLSSAFVLGVVLLEVLVNNIRIQYPVMLKPGQAYGRVQ